MYTKEELISQIKDKTIKRYLRETTKEKNCTFANHSDLIMYGLTWRLTKQGFDFWSEIYDHFWAFENGKITEVKTYEDFKHLDKSIK